MSGSLLSGYAEMGLYKCQGSTVTTAIE